MSQSLTDAILAECARSGSTRDSIVSAYHAAIRECAARRHMDFVDWPTVNRALLKRFKPSGLNYIKRKAWAGR